MDFVEWDGVALASLAGVVGLVLVIVLAGLGRQVDELGLT